MILSYSKDFIFIHLDKCGGTSIENALNPFLDKNDLKYGDLCYDKHDKINTGVLRKHSNSNEIKDYIKEKWHTMYKFTTVRNPKNLMISHYFYVKQNFKENVPDPYFIFYSESIKDKTGIDGFIKKMINSKVSSTRPMMSRIDSSVEIFDIDNINIHWPNILKKIKINEEVKLEKLNQSIKPNNIILKEETINLIYRNFKIDYETIPKITGHEWK
jgi:hypothetical protein